MIVGIHEELQVLPQLFVARVMVAADGGIFEGAVWRDREEPVPLHIPLGLPFQRSTTRPVLNNDAVEEIGPERHPK